MYHSAGTVAVNNNLIIGTDTDAPGSSYDLSGTGVVTTGGNLTVGVNGALMLNGSNSSITVGDATSEDFTLQTTGHLKFTLDGSGIGTIGVKDIFTVNNTDSLLTMDLTAFSGTGSFDLVTFDSMSGTFDSGNISGLTGLSGGRTASISYDADSMNLVIVPEPSSSALLGFGLGALALRRRRA